MELSIVDSSNADAFARYRMPKLITKIEGRGNGIKTVISNMSDIAKSLHCDPAYTTKFFGIELGAQSKYEEKTDRAIVNGAHNAKDLQSLLTNFIRIFILCPNCNLPETTMKVKGEKIRVACAACGHHGNIETPHRLTTYIVRNPPKAKSKSKVAASVTPTSSGGSPKAEKTKKSKKKNGAVSPRSADVPSSKAERSEVVWYTDTSAEAQEARRGEEMKALGEGNEADETVVDRVDSIMHARTGPAAAKHQIPLMESVREWIAEKKSVDAFLSELRLVQLARDYSDSVILSEVLEAALDYTAARQIELQLPAVEVYLQSMANRNPLAFWLAVQTKICDTHPEGKPYAPFVLKALYDHEILDESTILKWFESNPEVSSDDVERLHGVSVRESVRRFVEWLQSAEEEGDDDEEEEEE